MLCLSENDIEKSVSCKDMIDAVESAMIIFEEKSFHMPNRMHIDYEDNTLLLMPCFIKNKFSTKLVSVFPKNTEKNLPVVEGVVVLNDGDNGKPLAILNGAKLTAMRTAAVGSVGVRHTARENAQTGGVIGAGVQGFHQAQYVCAEREITDLFIYDKFSDSLDSFKNNLKAVIPEVNIHVASSVEDLIQSSQIIIAATDSIGTCSSG